MLIHIAVLTVQRTVLQLTWYFVGTTEYIFLLSNHSFSQSIFMFINWT